jgi:hypothetical protein
MFLDVLGLVALVVLAAGVAVASLSDTALILLALAIAGVLVLCHTATGPR